MRGWAQAVKGRGRESSSTHRLHSHSAPPPPPACASPPSSCSACYARILPAIGPPLSSFKARGSILPFTSSLLCSWNRIRVTIHTNVGSRGGIRRDSVGGIPSPARGGGSGLSAVCSAVRNMKGRGKGGGRRLGSVRVISSAIGGDNGLISGDIRGLGSGDCRDPVGGTQNDARGGGSGRGAGFSALRNMKGRGWGDGRRFGSGRVRRRGISVCFCAYVTCGITKTAQYQ